MSMSYSQPSLTKESTKGKYVIEKVSSALEPGGFILHPRKWLEK